MKVSQDIVNRLNQQQPDAFTVVYDAYFTRVYTAARHFVSDRFVAEDLAAEAFMILWLTHNYNDADHVKYSLLSTVKRLAYSHLQALSKESKLKHDLAANFEMNVAELEEDADQDARLLDLLDEVEQGMTARERDYFRLFRKGKKPEEIRQVLNLAPSTVYNLKQQTAKRIKKVLSPFRTSSVVALIFSVFGQ